MSQGGLSFMRPFWGFFYTPRRGRRVPPVLPTGVGPLFSGANAGYTLRPRPGLASFMAGGGHGVFCN